MKGHEAPVLDRAASHRPVSSTVPRALPIAALCLLLAAPAFAVGIGPSVEFYLDGSLHSSYGCGDSQFNCSGSVDEFQLFLSGSDYMISLAVAFDPDPDPEIFHTGNVFDIGAANTFGFVIQQGIVPHAAPGVVHDQVGSFTDGGNGSVPVSYVAPPVGISQDASLDELFIYSLSNNGGASWQNAGIDLVAGFIGIPTAGSSGTRPTEEEAGGSPGAGPFDAMRLDVNFGLEGSNDRYTWNGAAVVIPEPSTLVLLGLGLLGLGARRRRR